MRILMETTMSMMMMTMISVRMLTVQRTQVQQRRPRSTTRANRPRFQARYCPVAKQCEEGVNAATWLGCFDTCSLAHWHLVLYLCVRAYCFEAL